MQLEWDDVESKKCPTCGTDLQPQIGWPGNGEVNCPDGHYRGYAYSNFRRIPNFVKVVDVWP